jgi:hypothetical protein
MMLFSVVIQYVPGIPAYGLFIAVAVGRGLHSVHFSAQRKRFLCDKGCVWELIWGCLGGVKGYLGVIQRSFLCQIRLKMS